jgi:hypothetical protein
VQGLLVKDEQRGSGLRVSTRANLVWCGRGIEDRAKL